MHAIVHMSGIQLKHGSWIWTILFLSLSALNIHSFFFEKEIYFTPLSSFSCFFVVIHNYTLCYTHFYPHATFFKFGLYRLLLMNLHIKIFILPIFYIVFHCPFFLSLIPKRSFIAIPFVINLVQQNKCKKQSSSNWTL